MRFELLDEEDGLSNHLIYCIAQDSSGYLWVATNNGLNRYDGYSIKVFRHKQGDPTSLWDDYGHLIYVDKKGNLWTSFAGGVVGLFREDCQCFHNYQIFNRDSLKLPSTFPKILHRTEDGALWLSIWGMGLIRFNPETGASVLYNLPDIKKISPAQGQIGKNSVNAVFEDRDGLLWLATVYGLYSFDPQTEEFSYKHYTPIDSGNARNDYFNKIIPDGDKGFWLSSWGGGVCYYNRENGVFSTRKYHQSGPHTAIDNNVYDMVEKNDGEFWVATGDRGLGIFNKQTGLFRFVDDSPASDVESSPTNVSQILITGDSVMFLLNDKGLLKYDPSARLFRFKSLPIASSQYGNAFGISKVIEDPENNAVYFATELGNGLNVQDTRTGKLEALKMSVNPAWGDNYLYVGDMLPDRNGHLWVLARDYIYELDKKQRRLLRIADPFMVGENNGTIVFNTLHSDPDGDIWLLTLEGGLHRFFPSKRKISRVLNTGAGAPEHVKHVAWDKHGRMWLLGKGTLCVYDKASGQFRHPLPKDSEALTDGDIRGMGADHAGNIWIAINRKGLFKIDVQDAAFTTLQLINEENGLPSSRISSMNTDHDGMIWMATILGVVYMDAATLSYRIFNQTLGMEKNIVSIRFVKSNNGAFYITSPGKYCRVDFPALHRKASLPKVYIDKFSVDNQEQRNRLVRNATIAIHPGESFFSFEFGCLDFTNQALNRFAYMLEGWDKDWVESGSWRYASYTNLNGGRYVFKVKAANREGIWSEPIAIPVFIETPFYKKTWFALMAALVFAGLIYALYLYRIRQIEHTERLKTEFNRQLAESRLEALRAQMNPHFIFNSLNSINRYIIKSDIKTSSLYLTRFARLIRLILDNSENKTVVLTNELEALQLYVQMEALRFDHKFTFSLEIDPAVDADNIEIPPLIIQPYVENAIWHGLMHKQSGGHLSIKVTQERDMLTCEITDNGVGRAKAMEFKSKNAPTRKSVGMKLTEERLAISGADPMLTGTQKIIDLYDAQGEPCGTQVIITIPI
ncbi:MAG: hypothetical protein EP344_18235 [Bacteroidetes bacterium]|nr:MAG: hypothetical protein EP344_18235 [Bacteroidota bacterium]